jgi:hypothetical protein
LYKYGLFNGFFFMKVLIFIDYDILIRHFIKSNVFKDLSENHNVSYIFHRDLTSTKQGIYSNILELGLSHFDYLEVSRKRVGRWYHLFVPGMLNKHRGTKNYKPAFEQIRMNHTTKMWVIYWILSWPGVLQTFSWALKKFLGVHKSLNDFLINERPDVVIHPTLLAGYFINDLLVGCKSLDIPIILLMNSWDNPSNKAVVSGTPTKLVVWGEQTRNHAMEFLGLPESRIEMFGAAQFEVYKNAVKESREELCVEFGVPSNIPILLYGGASRSFNETYHLQLLDDAIEHGKIPSCHVLYRPHPWRGGLKNDEKSIFDVDLKHVTIDPHMEKFYRKIVKQPTNQLYISDYKITQKLLHLVDALISPLSTMLLESALHGKPALVMFVDAEPGSENSKMSDIIKKLVYFADFVNADGILNCDRLEDFPEKTANLLNKAKNVRLSKKLIKLAHKYTIVDGPSYSKRLLNLVDEVGKSGKH